MLKIKLLLSAVMASFLLGCGGGGDGVTSGNISQPSNPMPPTTFSFGVPIYNYFRGPISSAVKRHSGVITLTIGNQRYSGTASKIVLNQLIAPGPYVLGIYGGAQILLPPDILYLIGLDRDTFKATIGGQSIYFNIIATNYNINLAQNNTISANTIEVFMTSSATGEAYARYEVSEVNGIGYPATRYFIQDRKFINKLPGMVSDGEVGEFFTEFRCRGFVFSPEDCKPADRIDFTRVQYKINKISETQAFFNIITTSSDASGEKPSYLVYKFDGATISPYSESFELNGNSIFVQY